MVRAKTISQRGLSALLATILVVGPLLLVLAPTAAAAPAAPRQGIIDHCDDDSTSMPMLFTRPGNRTDCTLALDNHATVDNAYVDLTLRGIRSARSNPFDTTPDAFPVDPWLDVSGNGTKEWSFDSSRFGPLGHTTKFADGSTSSSVTLGANSSFSLAFDVPSQAEIINATITMSGDPQPYWAQQYQLTDSNWSDGEEGPALVAFDNKLWAAWSTLDPSLITGGPDDLDVVVRSYNGTGWSPVENIAPPPVDDNQDDREVVMAVYDGKLWVIWSHGDDQGSSGLTDLVYRTFDGVSWSAMGTISPATTDGLNTYEQTAVYNGRLWVLWKTTDTSISVGVAGEKKDIDIVIRSYDGPSDTWGATTELTEPTNNYLDWISDIAPFNGKLFVVWEASYWDFSQNYGLSNPPPMGDIHMRMFDGATWSPIQNMSESLDVTEGRPNEDQGPSFSIYENPVSGLSELYLVWMRGCLQDDLFPSCPTDYDIAFTKYNGAAWSAPGYLTAPEDTDADMFPCMADFNDVLYVFWVSGVNVTRTQGTDITLIATYGDIVYRAYNGREWSDIKEVTPFGHLDNVSHPACAVYNERLYVSWESPTNYADGSREWDITVRNIDFNKVNIQGVYGGLIENYTSPVNLSFFDTPFPFNLTELNALLGDNPVGADGWGNEMSRIPLTLSTEHSASLQVTGIDIRYAYHVRVNITQALNDQIVAERGDLYEVKTIRVPLQVGIGEGAGRISIDQIHIEYRIDYPPTVVKNIASIKIDEDSGLAAPLDLNDYFTDDWDAGHLRFEMGNATNTQHVLLSLEGSTLRVGTLTPDWCGVATFEVTAFDRNAYYARSNLVTVFVRCVNDPPQLQAVADINLSANQVFSGDLSAYDPDIGDILTFSSDSFFVDVNPDTGAFIIGNKQGMPDFFEFNVTVTDLAGANDSKHVTLTVSRVFDPGHVTKLDNTVDFPYYLFLLFLGPAAAYVAYRVRAQRLQALEEAKDDMQREADKADLKEMEQG